MSIPLNLEPSEPWWHPFGSARCKWQNDANRCYEALKLGNARTHDMKEIKFKLAQLRQQWITTEPGFVKEIAETLRRNKDDA